MKGTQTKDYKEMLKRHQIAFTQTPSKEPLGAGDAGGVCRNNGQ